ncbi:GGDEF domain-containing protein [Thiohalorhabdus methylotrophus]|uniref:GGDEF domain-containing protein n=1 Tax=Thiohalorhabdus methylotrophus TaxID=3242694 RepID=A0ABV4TS45_9GAMM
MPSIPFPDPTDAQQDQGALLEDTLRNRHVAILLQPIVSICEQEVYGYEALARGPEDTILHAPMALFEAARQNGRMLELELLCRELAIAQFGRLGLPGKLFLNVNPEALLEPGFRGGRTREFLERAGTDPGQVVIELTEHYPIQDFDLMREAVTHYRDMGFAIAIDDLGSGYAGLRQWSELRPDYVKIDRHFIQDLPSYPGKRQFVHSIGELAKSLECRVIAEGVETLEELEVVRHLGVSFGQGYHFARPHTAPPRAIPRGSFGSECQCSPFWHLTDSVGTLLQERPPLDPRSALDQVVDLFHHAPDLVTLPVVDGHEPLGIVRRYELMNLYTSRFGRELHGRKPISAFMRSEPLIVSRDTPVEMLSRRITEGDQVTTVDDDFIITDEEGRYLGMGTVVELLKKITELQIRNARYANPLTQLPGNVPIDEHIDRLLAGGEQFVVAYCDLDNFKPFNDTYGYARGDEVLRWLGRLLVEHTVEGRDFVGHVGGDDFILILRSGDWQAQCRTLLSRFEENAPAFYDEEARERGGIAAKDRRGQDVFYGFISLSIGAVPAGPERFHSHYEVASLTTEVKAQAKKKPGCSLFVDRRGTPGGPA